MSLQEAKDTLLGNNEENSQKPVEIVKPTEVIMEWEVPERVFKKQPREFFRRIAVIISFFVLLLIFIKEFLVIAVLGVVFFVTYVFYTIPPRNVKHQITNNGINYGGVHFYKWHELLNFYFEVRSGVETLILGTVDPLPGRLFLLLDKKIDKARIQELINKHLSIVEEPEKNIYEDWMKKISSKIKTS